MAIHRNLMLARLVAAAGASLFLLGAQASSESVRKAKPAPVQPVAAPVALGDEELVLSTRVSVGNIPCELGQSVNLRPDADALRSAWIASHGQGGQLVRHHAPGCPACDQSGYKGRAGVHEWLAVDPTLRRLIQTKAPSDALQESAMATGHFRTLRQDGILKVLQGLTTIDEVRAHCSH